MNELELLFVEAAVGEIVKAMRQQNPRLTPGEIYDAIAEELERRCKAVIAKAGKRR